MATPTIKIRVFEGNTIEEAAKNAGDIQLEKGKEKFEASHIVSEHGKQILIILTTCWV